MGAAAAVPESSAWTCSVGDTWATDRGAGPQCQQRDGNVDHAKSQKDSKKRSFCRTFIISLPHLNLKSIRNIVGIWFEVELSLMFCQMVN